MNKSDDQKPPKKAKPRSEIPSASPDYEVGYKKPPQHARFPKGRSGNPKGRPKDARNMPLIMEKLLDKSVTVSIDGIQQQVSGREAIAIRIFQKALNGDAKAIEILRETDRELEQKLRQIQAESEAEEESSEADQEILKHFLATHKTKTKKGTGEEK